MTTGPDIPGYTGVVKPGNSYELSIPKPLDQFVGAAHNVMLDVIDLYGESGFKQATIQLLLRRSSCEPERAHNPDFDNWHTHLGVNQKKPAAVDLLYSVCDLLPTEYRDGEAEKATQTLALTRFGAEIEHRSPLNQTGESLRRAWATFIVYPHHSPYYQTPNPVIQASGEDRKASIQRADELLADQSICNFHPQSPADLF